LILELTFLPSSRLLIDIKVVLFGLPALVVSP
jgi:hypothetical protein